MFFPEKFNNFNFLEHFEEEMLTFSNLDLTHRGYLQGWHAYLFSIVTNH